MAAPAQTSPVVAREDATGPVHRAAEAELGPEVAEALPEIKREPPKPADPGAQTLVQDMLVALGDRRRAEDGVTRVCLSKLRNQSRARPDEFNAFLDRFAAVLTHSARPWDIAFTAMPAEDESIQYEILGTAYLVTAEGFDLWELFIMVTPAGDAFTLWQPRGPVRVLRHERPGQQQVFPSR